MAFRPGLSQRQPYHPEQRCGLDRNIPAPFGSREEPRSPFRAYILQSEKELYGTIVTVRQANTRGTLLFTAAIRSSFILHTALVLSLHPIALRKGPYVLASIGLVPDASTDLPPALCHCML